MIQVREMWSGGPLREVSDVRKGDWTPLRTGEYGGNYICKVCDGKSVGLYAVDAQKWGYGAARIWICGPCRQELKAKLDQPEGLKRHAEKVRKNHPPNSAASADAGTV